MHKIHDQDKDEKCGPHQSQRDCYYIVETHLFSKSHISIVK